MGLITEKPVEINNSNRYDKLDIELYYKKKLDIINLYAIQKGDEIGH
ncbi:hypothetical protein [Wukongibacter baidiensis]